MPRRWTDVQRTAVDAALLTTSVGTGACSSEEASAARPGAENTRQDWRSACGGRCAWTWAGWYVPDAGHDAERRALALGVSALIHGENGPHLHDPPSGYELVWRTRVEPGTLRMYADSAIWDPDGGAGVESQGGH